ncbi:MAG: NADH-quinone oxidoreductase subunit NuoH [Planctomycetaceae bacterium]|nr:NADH-quinone oxidoreductase subunit NuoH [Planctomycetaceae bacterium]
MTPILAAGSIADFFERFVESRQWNVNSEAWGLVIAALIHAVLIINFFAVAPLFYIWLERKVAGRIQDRLGPTRVGGKFGWLQTLADGIKLIQKEDLCPQAADRLLFRASPYLVVVASFGAFIVLPWSDGWIAQNLDTGIFFMLAVMSLEVIGVILAGYSSGSKWSLFGGMREAAQVVSYEIPMAICVLVPVTALGTLNMVDISRMQSGAFTNWMVFHDPFCLGAFFVYFTVATASVKRAPFDLAEAESELVAGFHTEYSGIRWSYFFMAEYASMFAVSGIATALFLGGWSTGLGLEAIVLDPLRGTGQIEALGGFSLGNYVANLVGCAVFITKGCLLVFVQMWVRWTLPRLRIDQVMTTCLKYLLPISCFLFLGVTIWPVVLYQALGRTTLWSETTIGGIHFGVPLGNKANRPVAPRTASSGAPRTAAVETSGAQFSRLDAALQNVEVQP